MFDAGRFIESSLPKLREQIGDREALVALSGGIDSSIAAALVSRAIGKQLKAILLDTGFMREDEPEQVRKRMKRAGIAVEVRDVSKEFYDALEGLSDAEEKRKAFRQKFYTIFGREVKRFGCEFLVQGTIAPDWIETQGGIKSQHNVLQEAGIDPSVRFGFKVVEPISQLYKDQVRMVGRFMSGSPFQGPVFS